eukprot:TRINITY_DN1450_c1_g1_i1.p1 TRINITY_DN1450_c1_g1~~TRINITY_DN1450_c1_g1_i1.p1  ORF type:complete len:197 (-),score=36.26 TRINITY_DN1450_c1_g1_i1:36-626(-)
MGNKIFKKSKKSALKIPKHSHPPTSNTPNQKIKKILLLGDSDTGKSSILIRYADHTFYDTFIPTLAVDYKTQTVKTTNFHYKLQIWDTAGQERFRTITSSFYRNSDGIAVVFDVSNKRSFENVRRWLQEIERYDGGESIVVVVGNKVDRDRVVLYDEAKDMCDMLGISYFETSAKDDVGVDLVFERLCDEIYRNEL